MKTKMYPVLIMVMLLTMVTNFAAYAQCGGYTLTQGAYQNAKFDNPNAGGVALAKLGAAFPNGVTIGCAGGNSWTFTNVADIQNFLASHKGNDVVYSQVLTLALNVGFDSPNLGNQIVLSGPFAGQTVNQFLQNANDILGGCASGDLSAVNTLADAINNYYDEGQANSGLLSCCDKVGPVFSALSSKSVQCASDVVFDTPTATDAQDGSVAVTVISPDQTVGTSCSYTVTRTWTATDKCGNTTTASQTINVNDTTAPNLIADATVPTGGSGINACSAPAGPSESDIAALYADNCSSSVTVTKSGTPTGNSCGWSVTYNYSIKDACGNESTASVSYSGSDQTAPTLTGILPAGGTGINACSAPSGPSESDIAILYTDNCGSVTVAKSSTATGNSCAWSVTYNYSIKDACGNTSNASVTYSGGDKTAPTFTSVPSDVTATCSNIPGPGTPTATDNCGSVTISAPVKSTAPVDCSGNVVITYTWTATDACGNTATASQNISYNEITCKYTTVTQGGYGANCSGGNWGCYLDKNFASNFPNGLTVGSVANGKYVLLTSASAIHAFLPTGGTPAALTKAWTNPTKKTLPNTLVGQTVTLALNVKFFPNSANLVVLKGAFAGQTVSQVLAIANAVLGGSTAYSASSVNDVLNSININFDNGNGTNLGFLGYCVPNQGGRDIAEATAPQANEIVKVSTYPNPFVDKVKFEFIVEETSHVNLQLFNSNGAHVGTLFNDVAEKGVKYTAEFTSAQPGMYIYRMSTASGITTGKVIHIK